MWTPLHDVEYLYDTTIVEKSSHDFYFFKIFIFGDVVGGGEWKFMMGS